MKRVSMGLLAAVLMPFFPVVGQTPSEKPVTLLPGLGGWRHRINTSNPEAQKYFDQGLALLYGFNRYEALRSFRKASELDPKAPMPFWGEAMAQGPHINMDTDGDVNLTASCDAAQKGLALAVAPSRERSYLETTARRCPQFRPSNYINVMRDLAAGDPDDLDAATLYGESLLLASRWRWYGQDGAPAPGTTEAEHVLEEVLRRWPNHIGANHFYIHAVESSPNPQRGIPSAQRLMGLAPQAGHLVHMPGHIWLVLGDYEIAADVNARAADLDRHYMETTGVTMSSYGGYYIHNLQFLVYSRWMLGRFKDSLAASQTLDQEIRPMAPAMPEMVDPFLSMVLFTNLRFAQWDEIMKAAEPPSNAPVSAALWRFARTVALSAKGDHNGAVRERDALETARKKVTDRPWLNNQAADVLAVASEVAAARAANTPAAAIEHFQRAVKLQDALVYDEPPPWYQPLRESLGAALLRSGKAAEAEAVFREGIRRSPRNGRMLFGLVQSLKAQNKTAAADSVGMEYEAAWKKADVQLRLEDF